ncbi:sugar ABC transporter permease [Paenibacillus baekrokdamisoli]|uniref:Sugar ABC transporter permease n=1 Tax=Paenibacillus baekrokdamisoli TaxID=1712516 RepID=A0A3G9J9H1_9BACL|nr:ABC transporter permease subunit [Paenibacillus baekrokdamisoli]MBB3072460.1 ABC-type polysaccharide transport system permease subunit [Paenibacillus baekrokdamisoli]BBH20518.1 sugar ABC transporter permease [Paenibacillus baekrokdamisoli]
MENIPVRTMPVLKKKRRKLTKNRVILLLLALPLIVLIFLFNYLPLFGWIYAFYDYQPGIPLSMSKFVGFKFFIIAFTEERGELIRVLKNTLAISFLTILTSPAGVLFAVLLNEIKKKSFSKFIQTTTTLPNFISWILTFSIFYVFFSVNDGAINQLLLKLHLIQNPINFLGDSAIAWYFQIGIGLWKGLGWGAIIYLAAIAGIDSEMYDAANVDGAGRFRMIWYVTIPGIMPTYIVLLLLNVSNLLSNGFEQFYVFMNPLVSDKLEILDYYVYRIGFQNNDFAYATALGVLKTVISIIILFTVNRIAKRVRGENII